MYYKVLNEDGSCHHGGNGRWSLPTKNDDGTWTPGEWMPKIERLELCNSGYHVVTIAHLPEWFGPAIYEVEVRGEHLDAEDKSCWQEARLLRCYEGWNERAARLWACECAGHVLHIFEKAYPDDKRPRRVIETARRYALGAATDEELAAAGDAAWAAARTARTAWDAAWAAARTARTAWAATWAAAWAARAAAGAAGDAGDAAWGAAGAAERKWQVGRLAQYLGIE